MKPFRTFLSACLFALALTAAHAASESDLLAILQSTAAVPEKCAACQQLRVVGTAKAVPALAALLGEERTSHAARYALEGMPFPEAVEALRTALGTTTGLFKAGIIDSLGWRRDTQAVSLLAPLLADADPVIASATATALSRIGGPQAVAALVSAQPKVVAPVQRAVMEGLLRCAEALMVAGDAQGALQLYRQLSGPEGPESIRVAAWRGVVLSDAGGRAKLMTQALANPQAPLHAVAVKLLRELKDASVLKACLLQWTSLLADAQLAVLDAQVKVGAEALPTVRMASQSPHLAVRVAAWEALADLGDPASVSALAKAAARGEAAERDAARDTLTRVRGPGVREAMLKSLAGAEPLDKAELLRALGARSDIAAAPVLLQNAADGAEPVRLAALDSLRNLALTDTAIPLLELAAKSRSEAESAPVLKALFAVCQASSGKDQTARLVLEAMGKLPVTARSRVLPVLAELGTPAALEAAQAATRDANADYAKDAVRVLSQWPNAAPGPGLVELARTSTDPTLQILAVRGSIAVAEQEPDIAKRLALLRQARSVAKRPDEKRQALGHLGQIPTAEALATVMADLTEPGLEDEAALAAVSIAEKLAAANPALARETAVKVLAQCKAPEIVKRAWAIRGKPAGSAPFIQDWLVCGPYSQQGAVGALAQFDIPFGPEKRGEKVQWYAVPRAEQVNLMGLFPGQENCAAYLKAQLVAEAPSDAVLLLGSDDGVKAWLNGVVVHSNNIDRGDVADQDMAPIHLVKGANELMLKITQGGGGWSAHARIVGPEGQPVAGLRVEPAAGAPPVSAQAAKPAPAPAPTPKAASLPPRDTYQKLRLSDHFYAEGASYGDFNRDGKMDVVAGPFWFEGPDFQKRHEYRPVKEFDPKDYSDNFLTYVGDFNADGWPDVLCVPFPGAAGYWYENPAGKDGLWKQHLAYNNIGNESPVWGDVNGDGRSELVFCKDGYLGYAGPNPASPDQPWVFHAVSTQSDRYQRFTHGVGMGDLNGDGRVDILESAGWWEQPADATLDKPWLFHSFRFAEEGAQMLVYDVDGDGLADVITTWHCHAYGMVWWQQVKGAGGQADWKRHEILSPSPDVSTTDFRPSQMHALELVDMNGDGLKDILSGKRFWAHGPTGDKEPDAPAVLFWLELRRNGPGNATFVPHLIDDDSGVGTQVSSTDLNHDGRPDVIVANKKGIFVHLSKPVVK